MINGKVICLKCEHWKKDCDEKTITAVKDLIWCYNYQRPALVKNPQLPTENTL